MVYYFYQFQSVWTYSFPIYKSSYGIQKGSAYKKFFDHMFEELRENGQLDIYTRRNSLSHLGCSQPTREGNSLGMLKLGSLFLVFVLGVILSFIILCYEQLNQPKQLDSYQKVNKINEIFENTIKGLIPLLSDSSVNILKNNFENYLEMIPEMKTDASRVTSKVNEDR